MFARSEMEEEELIDEPECIGCLEMVGHPEPVKRSLLYTYRFPEQEFKFKAGDDCLRADTLERAGIIEDIDENLRILRLKLGNKNRLPERLCIIPTGPIKTEILREALYRFADSLISGNGRYQAIVDFLRRERPRMKGPREGTSIVNPGGDLITEVIDAASRLDRSYLFIQGPPGAGKTYTGSHLITALIKKGFRVGISSNSHKAINNLLAAVEKRAHEQGLRFTGIKKSSSGDPDSFFNGKLIRDEKDKQAVIGSRAQLLAEPPGFFRIRVWTKHWTTYLWTRPDKWRVGTADKFQGQEAQVVIVSMATSSGDDLPRYMEFLYSKNRLNVALSRAKCLAILVANPKLLTINSSTVEQMGLVNTLCWVESYSHG